MPIYDHEGWMNVAVACWWVAAFRFFLVRNSGTNAMRWMSGGCLVLGAVQTSFLFPQLFHHDEVLSGACTIWLAAMSSLAYGLWLWGMSRREGMPL